MAIGRDTLAEMRCVSLSSIGCAALPDCGSPEGLNGSSKNGYYYNASITTTYVKVFDTQSNLQLTVLW